MVANLNAPSPAIASTISWIQTARWQMRFPDFMTLGRRYVERSPGTWGHELCKLHKVHTGPTLKSWSADLSAIQDPRPANQPITELNLEQTMDEKKWEQIALLHANDIYFDRRAWELMERK